MSDLTIDEQATVAQNERVLNNAIVISNIIELTTNVVSKVAGKDVSDSIDGLTLTRKIVSNLVANRIKSRILKGAVE